MVTPHRVLDHPRARSDARPRRRSSRRSHRRSPGGIDAQPRPPDVRLGGDGAARIEPAVRRPVCRFSPRSVLSRGERASSGVPASRCSRNECNQPCGTTTWNFASGRSDVEGTRPRRPTRWLPLAQAAKVCASRACRLANGDRLAMSCRSGPQSCSRGIGRRPSTISSTAASSAAPTWFVSPSRNAPCVQERFAVGGQLLQAR